MAALALCEVFPCRNPDHGLPVHIEARGDRLVRQPAFSLQHRRLSRLAPEWLAALAASHRLPLAEPNGAELGDDDGRLGSAKFAPDFAPAKRADDEKGVIPSG